MNQNEDNRGPGRPSDFHYEAAGCLLTAYYLLEVYGLPPSKVTLDPLYAACEPVFKTDRAREREKKTEREKKKGEWMPDTTFRNQRMYDMLGPGKSVERTPEEEKKYRFTKFKRDRLKFRAKVLKAKPATKDRKEVKNEDIVKACTNYMRKNFPNKTLPADADALEQMELDDLHVQPNDGNAVDDVAASNQNEITNEETVAAANEDVVLTPLELCKEDFFGFIAENVADNNQNDDLMLPSFYDPYHEIAMGILCSTSDNVDVKDDNVNKGSLENIKRLSRDCAQHIARIIESSETIGVEFYRRIAELDYDDDDDMLMVLEQLRRKGVDFDDKEAIASFEKKPFCQVANYVHNVISEKLLKEMLQE